MQTSSIRSALSIAALSSSVAATGCLPELGEVDGRTFGGAVTVNDPRFGASASPGVVVLIKVQDGGDNGPAHVGAEVKRAFFPDTPPFHFNVSFACGKPEADGGAYTDPHSIWFNVFVGYYEIDVRKAAWGRPFGYQRGDRDAPIATEDILRIGKADWNYFSNYLYGVPLDVVRGFDQKRAGTARYAGRKRVGKRDWDVLELEQVEVLSAYVSGKDGQALVDTAQLSTDAWRASFGGIHPRPDFPKSFIPTHMRARIYMSFREGKERTTGERTYRTTLFGATTNDVFPDAKENDRFLEVQDAALQKVMATSYPDLGFD
jgi:hypothetical protein